MTFTTTQQFKLGLCFKSFEVSSFKFIYFPPSVIVPPTDFLVSQPATSGHPDYQLKHK